MNHFALDRRTCNGVTLLDIRGDLDIYTSRDLCHEFDDILEIPQDTLLNFSSTDYIDSTGLSVLIKYRARLHKMGKRLGICSPHENVLRILKITRLYEFFSVFDNEEEGLDSLSCGFQHN